MDISDDFDREFMEKGSNSKFPDYIKKRFSPSILCYYSRQILDEDRNFEDNLKEWWKNVMNEVKTNIRLVLPSSVSTISSISNDLADWANLTHTEPYGFLKLTPPLQIKGELPTISILRKKIFDMLFMADYLYSDIPIGIFIISYNNNNPMPRIDTFPKWIQPFLSSIHPLIIVYPTDNIEKKMLGFFQNSLLMRISMQETKIDHDYKEITGNMFSRIKTRGAPTKGMIAIKFYADLKFQHQIFLAAAVEYEKLFNTSMHADAVLMYVLCHVCNGNIDKKKLNDMLGEAFESSTEKNISLAILITQLYFVKGPKYLTKFNEICQSPELSPYINEQLAMYYSHRKTAFKLIIAATKFNNINALQHSVRCLWNAWGITVRETGFSLLSQTLLENMIRKCKHDQFTRCLIKSLSSPKIFHPETMRENLETYHPSQSADCGFITTSISRFNSYGYVATCPPGYTGTWSIVVPHLFSAFDRNRFIGRNMKLIYECGVNETIELVIYFHSKCSYFPIKNIKPITFGTAKVEKTKKNIERPRYNLVFLQLTPTSPGSIKIVGIDFDWLNIKGHRAFHNRELEVTVYSEVPKIELMVMPHKDELIVGEIIQIKIVITNGQLKLKYLAMTMKSDLDFFVCQPDTEELLGQRFIKTLDPGEEYLVCFSLCANSPGDKTVTVIFPYWTFAPPPRYASQTFHFKVSPAPVLPFEATKVDFQIGLPLNCEFLGFSSPYFNPNIHIVSVTKKKCVVSMISVKNDKYELELPDFVLPFKTEKKSLLWYKIGNSYYFHEAKLPPPRFSVIFNRLENDQFFVEIKNISQMTLKEVKVSIVDPKETISFLFSGILFKQVGTMNNMETVTMSFRLKMIDPTVRPKMILSTEGFGINRDLYFI